jgi:guanylate kinase
MTDFDSTMPSSLSRRGLMLVLSSPSGAGKSSISRKLLEQDDNISLSISVTSRKRRPGEVEGKDYHFVEPQEFQFMINENRFLEHAKVFDHYYGTPSDQVMAKIEAGSDVLFDIDWQGTQQLKAKARDDLISVFILPPSYRELETRLKKRNQDTDMEVAKRMSKAADELSHYAEYDYIIINHDLAESVRHVHAILAAERQRRFRMNGLTEFVRQLQSGY